MPTLYDVRVESLDGSKKFRVFLVGRNDANKIKLACSVAGITPEQLGLEYNYSVEPVSEIDGYDVKLAKKGRK